jgi:Family of unknown function (DUF5675)
MIPTVGPPLTLTRMVVGDDGAFGHLKRDDSDAQVAVTCERTFGELGAPEVVIPLGVYRCVRGQHTLDGSHFFSTYEVTGVQGHTGLLFHPGNVETDSKGCILLGHFFGSLGDVGAVLESRAAFVEFMDLMGGANEFSLTVTD